MISSLRRRVRDASRDVLRRVAATGRGARILERVQREADRALVSAIYDDAYYDGSGESGYGGAGYVGATTNAAARALVVRTWLGTGPVLDVGCASGAVVGVLRELGADASGVDVSPAALARASADVRPHLWRADLRDPLDLADDAMTVVTAFETLEHLRPADVPDAVGELARVAVDAVVATIPSFGPNPSGPDGWLDGKVRPERLDALQTLGPGWTGPVDHDDLARDAAGRPVEGHLTIASYDWWTRTFAAAGLARDAAAELLVNHDLARYGLTEFTCLYVLRPSGHPALGSPPAPVWDTASVADAEARLGVLDHAAGAHHVGQAAQRLDAAGLAPRVPVPGAPTVRVPPAT